MKVDFGRAALGYAGFRAGFPDRFHDELASRGSTPISPRCSPATFPPIPWRCRTR